MIALSFLPREPANKAMHLAALRTAGDRQSR